jgi:hypothetical protein
MHLEFIADVEHLTSAIHHLKHKDCNIMNEPNKLHKNKENELRYKMLPLNIFTTAAINFFPLHPHPIPQNSLQDRPIPVSYISAETRHLKPVDPFNVIILSTIPACASEDTQLLC